MQKFQGRLKKWCVITVVSLLLLISLVFALNQIYKIGSDDMGGGKTMTKELSTKKISEEKNNTTLDSLEKLTQQQVLDYWKSVLPDQVNKEMYRIRFSLSPDFDVDGWEIDPVKKQVTFYIFHIRNQSEIDKLQGEKIEDWTIRIVYDTAFENEYNQIFSELNQMKKKPELQILTIDMQMNPWVVPPEKEVIIWVKKQTPENQNLDKITLRGWNTSVFINSGVDANATL